MGKKDKNALLQKSPAEFFADNKNIAGFDNPGKSLYTTIRELVENSLDSAEGIGKLPSIRVSMYATNSDNIFVPEAHEYAEMAVTERPWCSAEVSVSQLNELRGISNTDRRDEGLYRDNKSQNKLKVNPSPNDGVQDGPVQEAQGDQDAKASTENNNDAKDTKEGKKSTSVTKGTFYYKVTVEILFLGAKAANETREHKAACLAFVAPQATLQAVCVTGMKHGVLK